MANESRISRSTIRQDKNCDHRKLDPQSAWPTCGQVTAGLELEQWREVLPSSLPRQDLEKMATRGILQSHSCEGGFIWSPCSHAKVSERSRRSTYGPVCLRKVERVEPSERVTSIDARVGPSQTLGGHGAGGTDLGTNSCQPQSAADDGNTLAQPTCSHHVGANGQTSLRNVEPMGGSEHLSPARFSVSSDGDYESQSRSTVQRCLHLGCPVISDTQQRHVDAVPNLQDLVSSPLLLPGSNTLTTDALTMIPMFDSKESRHNESQSSKTLLNVSRKSGKRSKKEPELMGHKEILQANNGYSTTKQHARQEQAKVKWSFVQRQLSIASLLRLCQRNSVFDSRDQQTDFECPNMPEDGHRRLRTHGDDTLPSADVEEEIYSHSDEDCKTPRRKPDAAEPPEALRPDTDYHWTEYEKAEERRFYEIARVKLMDPKRGLCSQILLSNFMNCLLDKVQRRGRQ